MRSPGGSIFPRQGPSIVPLRESAQREYLAVGLAGDVYALPLSSIREILMPQPVTEVPRAPDVVLGIFSVRGRVTTLIDLRRRLGLPQQAITGRSRVLLVDGGQETIGLLVDSVSQVHRLVTTQIEPASSIGGALSDHVVGIGRPGIDQHHAAADAAGTLSGQGSTTASRELLILLDPESLLKV